MSTRTTCRHRCFPSSPTRTVFLKGAVTCLLGAGNQKGNVISRITSRGAMNHSLLMSSSSASSLSSSALPVGTVDGAELCRRGTVGERSTGGSDNVIYGLERVVGSVVRGWVGATDSVRCDTTFGALWALFEGIKRVA